MTRKSTYKGSTPGKNVNRSLVWLQHEALLGKRGFKKVPHVFLASRFAEDVHTLRKMGVDPSNTWAVEREESEFSQLIQQQTTYGFYLFTEEVEHVMRREPAARGVPARSVYLDFCGNLIGSRRAIEQVAATMEVGSVLSITLSLGRECKPEKNREAAILRAIRKGCKHQVTVVQSVLYQSSDQDRGKGSPMGTWTLYLGPRSTRSRLSFDLRRTPESALKGLGHQNVAELLGAKLKQAQKRSQAAVKANITRRV